MKGQVHTLMTLVIATGAITGLAVASTPPPDSLITVEEAEKRDAEAIATSFGISVEEAREVMVTDELSAKLAAGLSARYATRLAGMYIDHINGHRLVVRLTGPQAVRTEFHHKNAATLEIRFETGAAHTLRELKDAISSAWLKELSTQFPEVHARHIDERTGEIVIKVDPGADIETIRDSASANSDVPIRIEEQGRATVAALFGSGTLVQGGCTNGFVVNHAGLGVKGTLAAAHCATGAAQTYNGIDGASHSVTQRAALGNANADIMWFSIPTSVSYGGHIWDGAAWRAVTGRRTQAVTMTGHTHCKYGRLGGGSCGAVVSTAANPGSACGPGPVFNKPCNASFVHVQGPSLYCIQGDSGGPFWTGSTLAAGIVTHALVGGGNQCWYTSTDYAYSNFALNLVYP